MVDKNKAAGHEDEDDVVIVEDPNEVHTDDEHEDDEQYDQDNDDEAGERSTSRSAEDVEQLREKRREEKKRRAENRRKAMERDKLELKFLRQRNDDLERRITSVDQRLHQNELGGLNQRIAALQHSIGLAEQVIAKAVDAKNGEDVVKATKLRDQYRDQLRQLNQQKTAATAQPQQQRQQQPAVDPRIVEHAQKFVNDHKWYNPQQGGEETGIVMAIDQALTDEGYDPTSQDYWDELRERVKERLPERFTTPRKRDAGGPQLGSGRSSSGTGGKQTFYISPERKQALIDAGVWDDPVLRKKYVKKYMEYDRQNIKN